MCALPSGTKGLTQLLSTSCQIYIHKEDLEELENIFDRSRLLLFTEEDCENRRGRLEEDYHMSEWK